MPKPKSTSLAEPDEANNLQLDPVLDAMLEHLPAPGDPFPNRALWLQIWELLLKLIYPEEQGESGGSGSEQHP